MKTTSVVMATYNGEKYIIDQLQSLYLQTLKIDEVIICDDGSTDNTVQAIHDFIKKNDLKNWSVKVNSCNMGWRKNFINLLSIATGDIIFTCDQDDIWDTNKVSQMVRQFDENNDIQVLVSDYSELVGDGGLAETPKIIKYESVKNLESHYVYFDDDNFFLKRPGCVFAIRRSFVYKTMKYINGFSRPVHDQAMWGSAILANGLFYYPFPMIKWRKHGKSSMKRETITNDLDNDRYHRRIDAIKRRQERILAGINFLSATTQADKKKLNVLTALYDEGEYRVSLLEKKQILRILFSLNHYRHLLYYFADLYHLLKFKF